MAVFALRTRVTPCLHVITLRKNVPGVLHYSFASRYPLQLWNLARLVRNDAMDIREAASEWP